MVMALESVIENSLKGLGLALVDVEHAAGGVLRVTIDHPWEAGNTTAPASITLDDCERASRQLQHALEVEGQDYKRLEVSSPGLDRPLRREADYQRFEGALVDLLLHDSAEVVDANGGRASGNRFRGYLQRGQEQAWRLLLTQPDVSLRSGAEQEELSGLALDFELVDVRSARLVPVLDFRKGQRKKRRSMH